MALLQAQDISCSFGERALFTGCSFTVEKQDKIGLIGSNGVGKTTLLKILAGKLSPTNGQVASANTCRIGYLEQHALPDSDMTLYEAVESVFAPLREMEKTLVSIGEAIDRGEGDAEVLTHRQHTLTEAYQAAGGLTYQSRTKAAIRGIGFTEEDFQKPVRVLSGGERTMASLVRLLLSDVDLLLLDEPTNHLDMDACTWLEDYLRAWQGAAIIISHDRYFLDHVTNKTMRLYGGKFTLYTGGYTAFTKKREAEESFAAKQYEKQLQEIKRIEGIIETQRRFNRERNIRMAESKQKQIDRIRNEMEKPPKAEKGVFMQFSPSRKTGGEVLRVENLEKSFDGRTLFSSVSFTIYKNERVFLLGPNGCGKTTLFNLLRGAVCPDSGHVTMGTGVDVGYFDQKQSNLVPTKTALSQVRDAFPQHTETQLRGALAALGLRGDAVHAEISTLSGGERAKVALTMLLLSRPNFLLLDEPTNHLDIDAKEALETALLQYGGTILAVSHDRYFIDKLATRVLAMEQSGVDSYDGDYSYYQEKRKMKENPAFTPKQKAVSQYKEEKALRAAERKEAAQVARLEAAIAKLEETIAQKNRETEEAGADYVKAMALAAEVQQAEAELAELYEAWENAANHLFT
ncbi:MAG: ABC-F family ATP-binding cassette domain-containing protein [Clostridia bacterium]|nr:ABC-F family ATP-binding cassette domain-containing protein [Clostridia bacterium]